MMAALAEVSSGLGAMSAAAGLLAGLTLMDRRLDFEERAARLGLVGVVWLGYTALCVLSALAVGGYFPGGTP